MTRIEQAPCSPEGTQDSDAKRVELAPSEFYFSELFLPSQAVQRQVNCLLQQKLVIETNVLYSGLLGPRDSCKDTD